MPDQIKIVHPTAEGLVIQGNQVGTIVLGVSKQGPPGVSGVQPMFAANFAYGDATPATLVTIAAGKRAYHVRLFIETAFNGTGASLSVGSVASPQELMATTENNPAEVGGYLAYPNKKYVGSTAILLTIVPGSGASAGAGHLQIDIQP